MKKLALLLVLLALIAGSLPAVAAASLPGDIVGQTFPDFAFTDTEGQEVRLSDLLSEKDAVVISLFASWCEPCREELPLMQSVMEKHPDRLEVLGLSAYPKDTVEKMAKFREKAGLNLHIGLTAGTGIDDFFATRSCPVNIILDRTGAVVYASDALFTSEAEFEALALSRAGSGEATYTVTVVDQNGDPVPEAAVGFCVDTGCRPVEADENGVASLTAEPAAYHLKVVDAPEGYDYPDDTDITIGPDSGSATLTITKE